MRGGAPRPPRARRPDGADDRLAPTRDSLVAPSVGQAPGPRATASRPVPAVVVPLSSVPATVRNPVRSANRPVRGLAMSAVPRPDLRGSAARLWPPPAAGTDTPQETHGAK